MEEKIFQSSANESETVVSKGESSPKQKEIEPIIPTTLNEAIKKRKDSEVI